MSKESALSKYTNAVAAVEEHAKENKTVFESHQRLVGNVIDAENELRDAVAESGSGVSNGLFTVTYAPVTQTVFDEEKVRKACPDAITVNQRPPKITIGKERAGI